ncbi:MAG: ATP-grasp domain-containing protein [Bacteroidetes bacterium]|nr:ATP-grasp domain-containing protein [Bacteroidota bacterium]
MQWIIQENLMNPDDFNALNNACAALNIPIEYIKIIPFSDALPEVQNKIPSIVYGSITFNRLATKDPLLANGVFYNEALFSMENYLKQWGHHMLNEGAVVTTIADFVKEDYEDEKQFFIRPDDDNKSFAGTTMSFGEIKKWKQELEKVGFSDLTPESKIIAAAPMEFAAEWRCWIVNKKVVEASLYRKHFVLTKERGCPPEVIHFAEARCAEYTPHDVFVMDICRCGDAYYIVECGCMNACGFYKADISVIIAAVSGYFYSKL